MKKIKILILFYSGTGSTRLIANLIKNRLDGFPQFEITDREISLKEFPYEILLHHDYVIMGSPTHFMAPSKTIEDFIDAMPAYPKKIKAIYYFTASLEPGNHARKFIKKIVSKNVTVIKTLFIKAPGCDYLAFLPKAICNRVAQPGKGIVGSFDKQIHKKIDELIRYIPESIHSLSEKQKIPFFKLRLLWIRPIAFLIDYFLYIKRIPKIHILEERCVNCQTCVKTCIRECFSNATSDYPKLDTSNCEFCLGCVHSCPEKAIVFAEYMKDVPRFDHKFFKELKKQLSSK
jgi:ferredoxin/flavodoxin